jgi:peptidoglycan/xylan/chitin deacetylase (PgdA/CDA1 family)
MNLLKRIKNKSKAIFNDVVFESGLLWSVRFKNAQNIIYNYHGIDSAGITKFNRRHVLKGDFDKQIRFLKKYCNVISLQDFFNEKFDPDLINVALTFDDGYKNNLENALPILEKYQAPATFFITGMNTSDDNILWPDFLNIASTLYSGDISLRGEKFRNMNGTYFSLENGKSLYEIIKKVHVQYDYKREMMTALEDRINFKENPLYDEYWKLMSDDDIIKCSKSPYIEIGSHGMLHQNLGNLPLTEAEDELRNSKAYLENLIQREVVSIGYPDGSYSRPLLDSAEKMGYFYQFASEGFLYEEDYLDERILDRKGVYSIGSPGNQILSRL